MGEIKIPFGRSPDGKMMSIEVASRGLECQCFCCVCDSPLVARKGDKNQHHFAHSVEPGHCAEARETALHKFAKQLICEALELRLPDDLDLGQMRNAAAEVWLDGIRPDVLAQFDEPVAIEIFVAHSVPIEKFKVLTARKLATVEIDLSLYRHADKNQEQWRDLILRTAPRFWLFQPVIVRAAIERAAQIEADRIKREQQEREALIERERLHALALKAEWEKREYQRRVKLEYRLIREKLELLECFWDAMEDQEKSEAHELAFLEGLKICSNTGWHLQERERRKNERTVP